jgi:tetratricopeptide (TPR) repeat protein
MGQMKRQEQILHKAAAGPNATPQAKQEYSDYKVKRAEFELKEYTLWAENYPTEMAYRYEIGHRQYTLKLYDDAIGSYQQARHDPKYKVEASIMLGKSFMEADFLDEADETLAAVIQDSPSQEGIRYKDMVYWRARVLEMKGRDEDAIKLYSQIFQLESGYRDVSSRIKALRKKKAEAAENAKRAGEAAQEQLKEESF